jgi:hypothetical protein
LHRNGIEKRRSGSAYVIAIAHELMMLAPLADSKWSDWPATWALAGLLAGQGLYEH